MSLGFGGEIPDLYHQYRRGYPPAVIDEVAGAFGLTGDDVVVDLGCGTGQLALPMAGRVRAVLGVDPEPGMLRRARRAAAEQDIANVSWMIGADTDLPAIAALLGARSAGALTIGQALHWMNRDELFQAAFRLVRPGGGVAVIANGTPLWQQDTAWSRALRRFLEQWTGRSAAAPCGTDAASTQRYRDGLAAAGYGTAEATVEYRDDLDMDQLVGGVYSALGGGALPAPDARPAFAEQIREAVAPHLPLTEHVRVTMLFGRARPRRA
jgi:SAM-dependent methyltransferase